MFLRCAFSALLGIALPEVALAHPTIDEGRRLYDEADFEGALSALARAEAAAELSRGELASLYALRALVYRGMRQEQAMDSELRRLLFVDPDHSLDAAAPPEVHQRLGVLHSDNPDPIRLEVLSDRSDSAVTIRANVFNDELSLVRQVRVTARVQDDMWTSMPGPLEVPSNRAQSVEYYAQAVGPGGVVLASGGSAEDPLVDEGETARPPAEPFSPWVWVGIAAAAIVVIGGFIVLSATVDSGDGGGFQPTLPMRAGLFP